MLKFDIQMFADGNNNDLPARNFSLEFKEMLQAVFAKQSYFGDFFAGGIEALDGVQENEHAFYVKTSDIPCVINTEYDKGENVAFGTGTGLAAALRSSTKTLRLTTPGAGDSTRAWTAGP